MDAMSCWHKNRESQAKPAPRKNARVAAVAAVKAQVMVSRAAPRIAVLVASNLKVSVCATIGIGANLGAAAVQVKQAIAALASLPQTTIRACSSLYASAPVDATGDDYVNAVLRIDTGLSPAMLLSALQALELAAGRERPYQNAPRTLDLDLLLYGDDQINSATLTVPHPRMLQRAFVLLPLLEIDPLAHIPGHGLAQDYLADVATQVIRKMDD